MRQRRQALYRWFLCLGLCVALFPILTAAQCGLQDLGIPLPEIKKSFTFTADIDKLAAEALKKKNIQTADGTIPKQAPAVSVPVDITESYDLRENPDVKKYKGKIKYVGVSDVKINVTPTENTSNTDIPVLDLSMRGLKGGDFEKIGEIGPIKAGATGTTYQAIANGKAPSVEKYLKTLKIDINAKTALQLKGGDKVPKGKITLRVDLSLKLKITPFK